VLEFRKFSSRSGKSCDEQLNVNPLEKNFSLWGFFWFSVKTGTSLSAHILVAAGKKVRN